MPINLELSEENVEAIALALIARLNRYECWSPARQCFVIERCCAVNWNLALDTLAKISPADADRRRGIPLSMLGEELRG
jgi:hypothetical protein